MPKIQILLVDDDQRFVTEINRAYASAKKFLAVQCTSLEEVNNAIKENKPEVLFFDHSLTRGGNEGFAIAEKHKNSGIRIISITSDDRAGSLYLKKGIELAPKTGLVLFIGKEFNL